MGSGQLALELLAPLERWVKKWVVKNGFWLPCMQNGVDNIAATIFFFFPPFSPQLPLIKLQPALPIIQQIPTGDGAV